MLKLCSQDCRSLPNLAKMSFFDEFFSIADFCQNSQFSKLIGRFNDDQDCEILASIYFFTIFYMFEVEINYYYVFTIKYEFLASSENFIVKNLQTHSIFKLFFKI